MSIEIVNIKRPASTPRIWTYEQLKNGEAPEGIYEDADGNEFIRCIGNIRAGRVVLDIGGSIESVVGMPDNNGPYKHVGTVERVVLHVDRSRAVK